MAGSFEYREDYAQDPDSWAAFKEFLIDIHGLDLSLWEQRVGVDPDFVSFSFFHEGRIVASTSVYSMDVMLRGEWARLAQISSVGTRKRWRRRGLNAELTRRALDWIEERGHLGTFLFSDDDAVGFYAKQGFVEIPEWSHSIPVSGAPRSGSRRLGYDLDESLIRRLVETRTPISHQLGSRCPKLELFHFLYENAGDLHYLEAMDVMVATEQEDGVLTVYDVVGSEIPPWQKLEGLLIDGETRSVRFAFTPDRLGLENAEPQEDRSSRLHVRAGESLFAGRGMMPFTAHA